MCESKVEVLRGMREQRDRNPKVMKKKKNVCVCVPAACLCIFDVDIHIGVYVFSITTAPYRGAKHGCHPCFPGTSAVAETAEMAGLLFEIRSW